MKHYYLCIALPSTLSSLVKTYFRLSKKLKNTYVKNLQNGLSREVHVVMKVHKVELQVGI